MTLNQFAHVVTRYRRSIIAVLVSVIAATALVTWLTPGRYTSSASLFLTVRGAASASDLNQGGSYTERQVASYARVATSAMVLDAVIQELALDTSPDVLARDVAVTSPAGTAILRVSATQPTPQRAQEVANKISQHLVSSISKLSPASGNTPLVSATVIDPALLPTEKSSPKTAQNIVLGGLVALLLAFGQALVRQTLDTRVRRVDDVVELTGHSVVASIAKQGTARKNDYGYGSVDEDFRRLRTNLRFLGLGTTRSPCVVVTSARSDEGKTHTTLGLARVLAEAGQRVLVVDADLRRPRIAERLGLDAVAGLSQVLSGQLGLRDTVQRCAAGGFDVLPSGPIPPNPAELLGMDSMRRVLETLKTSYDLVILDTAPVLPVTDGVILSHMVGACLLVARAGVVTKSQLAEAAHTIQAGGGEVLGVILNDTDPTGQHPFTPTSDPAGSPNSPARRAAD